MVESAGPEDRGAPASRCLTAWRVVDDAVRREVLEALDGLGETDTVTGWSQRLESRAAVTDTALRDLRDSYLAMAAQVSRARLAQTDRRRAGQ